MALHRLRPSAIAGALATAVAALGAGPLWAQSGTSALPSVTVAAKSAPLLDATQADVGGWNTSLAQSPQSIVVLGRDLLDSNASTSLSQALRLDAALADSYNTTGYVENLSVRGFSLNNDGNTLRNGLAVSSYAPWAIENKDCVEILKGVSGLQSGVSAPGGLVNLVTKVPLSEPFTTVEFSTTDNAGGKLHLDNNSRWGALGLRLNLVSEALHPAARDDLGQRQLASLALALPLAAGSALSMDLEYLHQAQPSVPGLGLLDRNGDGVGETLPTRIDPRLNLNNQSWSQPFDATATVAQIAFKQRIDPNWQASLGLSVQRSVINDRLAFPDGCSSAATYVYPGLCANGDVDLYDYRSNDEVRSTNSWDLQLHGRMLLAGLEQQLRVGASGRDSMSALPPLQTYNFVGVTNIYQPISLPADPTLTVRNTNSQERSTEVYAALQTQWSSTLRSFAGVRVSRLARASALSDGSEAIALAQTVSTPWLGGSWSPTGATTWYASWGQGVELQAVPNRPQDFANPGQVLPAQKSEQVELGWKWQARERLLVSAALFSIEKPFADDQTQADGSVLQIGGGKLARHRGLDLAVAGALDSQWSLQASLELLDARWVQALSPELVGQRVTNVPRNKLSLFADYKVASLPGLSWHGLVLAEGEKAATPDGLTSLPASWQIDAGASYRQRLGQHAAVWNLQVENLTDRVYWREAPTTDWGGIYLFAAAPRTLHASVTLEF